MGGDHGDHIHYEEVALDEMEWVEEDGMYYYPVSYTHLTLPTNVPETNNFIIRTFNNVRPRPILRNSS